MTKIDWQTGILPLEVGTYLITLKGGEITIDKWIDEENKWWSHDADYVLAWCPIKEIPPYVEPKFKIGEFIVENGIIGIVTSINDDGSYYVIGAALMPMTFTPNMCRLATSDEALSISAKLRERGMYYDVDTNKIKNYETRHDTRADR